MDGGIPEFERVCGTNACHEHAQYDLVICLDVPTPEIYEQVRSNNAARSESYEQARILGDRIHEAWYGHRNLRLIRDFPTWNTKMMAIVTSVAEFLDCQ
jgi:hypothetical protein